MFLKYFLPIYLVVFFLVAFVWRTVLVWKKTGQNAYVLLKSEGVYGIIGRYFRFLPALSALVVVVYSFFNEWYHYLAPFAWLQEVPALTFIGIALLLASLVWIAIAQSQMGESWRIGIDQGTTTDLVTVGLFRYSRNPIFLGIIINVLGFFLVLPNAITLLILVLDTALIQIQVSLEEEHLKREHGASYEDYCQQVRRWL